MLDRIKSDYISWIVLIGVLLLAIEVTFFHGGLIFSLFISGACIYLGKKRLKKTLGKLFFWIGCISLFITIINMMTFKFLLFALILYFIIIFFQSKKTPNYVKPTLQEPTTTNEKPRVESKKPLFSNIFIGKQETPDHVYEWNDVNIQKGFGDTIIDLSYTVLPKGESVINIRNLIGNVIILIPYDNEVCLHHSVIFGATKVLEHEESKLFNQIFSIQTSDYEQAQHKIKVLTSMVIGDIEVKRV